MRTSAWIPGLVALAAVAGAPACGSPPPSTLVGDAFLAHEFGTEVNLRDLPVHLVPEEETLDTLLAAVCPPRGAEAVAEAPAEAWRARARVLTPRVARSAVTDARAAFAFDDVPPGRYRVWADTVVGTRRWTWLVPVRVRGGDTIRVNLTNGNHDDNPFRCPW